MNIRKKIIYVFCFFIVLFLLFNIKSYAGTQEWKSLDYDVTIKPNGDMDVIETWDIKISETNTLFKDFNIDYSKYSSIENVNVSRVIESGNEISLTQIFEEQYHVDSGCYYALPIKNRTKFEIAWNVGLDNSSENRIYKLYYTIKDAVKIYNDCTELYWMFLGTDNTISGKNITGTIKLPQSVSNIEKLRVWAHGPLSGDINRVSEDTVSFSLPSLQSNTMLEVRIVTEENIYSSATNVIYENYLNEILTEEKQWANEANLKRKMNKIYNVICIVVVAGIVVFFYQKRKIYTEMAKEFEEKYYIDIPEIEYFRDIPDEKNATPARASFLYTLDYVSKDGMERDMSKIFAATILDLSLKGIISFEPIDTKMFKIIFNDPEMVVDLSEDENEIYKILKNAHAPFCNERNYITTKELTNYTAKNYEKMHTVQAMVELQAKKAHKLLGNIDIDKSKLLEVWERRNGNCSIAIIVWIILLFFIFPVAIQSLRGWALITLVAAYIAIFLGIISLSGVSGKVLKKVSILTEKGILEQQEWKALKKYMKDYSLLSERSVPDIVLWEKFLVYATTFGISKQVIEQLKTIHPEMFTSNTNDNMYYGRYAYWDIVTNPNYGENCFSNFSNKLEGAYKSAQSAYNAAHSSSSSGSGGGGGFSSGGGGRRRRRRLRRTLNSKSEI